MEVNSPVTITNKNKKTLGFTACVGDDFISSSSVNFTIPENRGRFPLTVNNKHFTENTSLTQAMLFELQQLGKMTLWGKEMLPWASGLSPPD
jgi:hypothetical protein